MTPDRRAKGKIMPISTGDRMPDGFSADAPDIAIIDVPACPACGSAARDAYAAGYDYEMQTCRNHWTFVRCRSCASVYLDKRPDNTTISVIYPRTYYSYTLEKTISPIARYGKMAMDWMKFRGIVAAANMVERYLDVGCGDGRYLRMFARRGLEKANIHGIELNAETVQALRSDGFSASAVPVEEDRDLAPDSFDLVTMFHVIEHVPDPRVVAEKIFSLLKPGGVFAVETPNLDALDARLFRRGRWGGYHIPRHWTIFSSDSICQLLREAGFVVERVQYQTGHSFWMYSIHHVLKFHPRPWIRPFARFFDPMRGLVALICFTGFDTLRQLMGFRTSAVLVIARKPNRQAADGAEPQ